MFDFTGADAERKGSEGAVGRGVAVTAYHGGAGEGETLLGADDMDNTLSLVAQAKVCNAKLFNILLEGDTLCSGVVFFDEAPDVFQGLS